MIILKMAFSKTCIPVKNSVSLPHSTPPHTALFKLFYRLVTDSTLSWTNNAKVKSSRSKKKATAIFGVTSPIVQLYVYSFRLEYAMLPWFTTILSFIKAVWMMSLWFVLSAVFCISSFGLLYGYFWRSSKNGLLSWG